MIAPFQTVFYFEDLEMFENIYEWDIEDSKVFKDLNTEDSEMFEDLYEWDIKHLEVFKDSDLNTEDLEVFEN